MDSTNIQTPRLNISNIKSPLSGGGSTLGNVGQAGTSKVGTLAKIVRKNRISINSLVKSQEVQDRKITIIKNVIRTKQQNIGKKLFTGSEQTQVGKKFPAEGINNSLVETNKILLDIQKQLVLQSQNKQKEEKEERDKLQRVESKKKLKAEESAIEKTGKKIAKAVVKTTSKLFSPITSIFDKVLDFIITLGAGIATNAVFEWLKDEENIEKVKGWFSWIKDNWKWMAAAVGAIALLPVIGAISGLLGPVGIIVGLLGKAVPLLISFLLNPLTLKAMLAIGAGILIYKGGEFLLRKARNFLDGGEDFTKAKDILNQKLIDAGMDKQGNNMDSKNKRGRSTKNRTEEQEKIFQEVKKKRKALDALKDQMNAEIKEKQSKLEIIPTQRAGSRSRRGSEDPNVQARNKVDMEVKEDYKSKISNILTPTTIEARKMGGPVMSGRPYLVGESGPEIFAPNINGSVINNMRTEKIYQMISSDMSQTGGINMIELPPITNQLPPPEIPVPSGPSTEVPEVSSVNLADPYRQLTPMLYGITV